LLIALGLVAIPLTGAALSGCVTLPGGERGLESLETMSEVDFRRFKLYSTLGVKVAAHRLVEEEVVTAADLAAAADVLESLEETPVTGGAELLVEDLLTESGLTSSEVRAILELVVFELQAAGLFDQVGLDGTLELGPRTKELVDALIAAVREVSEEA
jgi:hypothetical protein